MCFSKSCIHILGYKRESMVGFGADKKKGSKQKVKARNRERE